jgi:tetratricopeptide (TPR) repeat protein
VQPLRAQHAGDAVTARLAAGEPAAAVDIAKRGVKRNPLSPEPLWELASARSAAGDPRGAQQALERAVDVQPASAEAWRRLGRFRLDRLDDPEGALDAFRPALYLDPQSPYSQSDVIEATRARLAAGLVAPTQATPLPPGAP